MLNGPVHYLLYLRYNTKVKCFSSHSFTLVKIIVSVYVFILFAFQSLHVVGQSISSYCQVYVFEDEKRVTYLSWYQKVFITFKNNTIL